MIEYLKKDYQFWTHFPLELNNKTIRNGTNPLIFETINEPSDTQGSFYNSIIKLKSKPERTFVKNEELYSVNDAPVTMTRRSRPNKPTYETINNDPNFYQSVKTIQNQFRNRNDSNAESFIVESSNQTVMEDPTDIDIDCEEPFITYDLESYSSKSNFEEIDRYL